MSLSDLHPADSRKRQPTASDSETEESKKARITSSVSASAHRQPAEGTNANLAIPASRGSGYESRVATDHGDSEGPNWDHPGSVEKDPLDVVLAGVKGGYISIDSQAGHSTVTG